MKMGLLQEQTMRLAMTQELRQAITMLQYNAQELTEFLYEQSLDNPLIELKSFDRDKRRKTHKQIANSIEIYGDVSVSLQQHLLEQLHDWKLSSAEKRIASFVISNIDENGYLQEGTDEMAKWLSVSVEEIENCIQLVQKLEPTGVAARTLQECLTIQLKRLQKGSEMAECIIENYFDLLAKKDWKQLVQALKCTTEDLQGAVQCIMALQPRPGLAFSTEKPFYIVPDLNVTKINNQLVIQLNEEHMPKIEVHAQYSALLREAEHEVASYISEKHQQLQWLVRSLEQRKRTLLQVMDVIVDRQREFFLNGPLFLKPLQLKEVAEELGFHESTISRAARGKYVQTPYGLMEMKYFFSNAVSAGEEGTSSKRVKGLIQTLIDKENKKKPLSDQKICDLLTQQYDILVSRRTVAKYREQLHIPASSLRKTIG
ncbi:RNA polymerase factor sigma-54 [Ectobacillus funiculus]|uniref:RNA polymerase factor sigma-54 n=1 Tax=Ectobacillus funiculus TaxID=137993 RepID=UPI00101B67CF|nr:RNA polymerase factor sigma-54 [Ectobacillus funiculus]